MTVFHEEWFCQQSQDRLAFLAATAPLGGPIVEFGSWEGRSSIALANAVAPLTVHCVDTWNGSPGEISAELAAERDVYATFCANTAGLNIEAHRMGWRDYADRYDGPVSLLFIDFEHTYQELFDCLTLFKPRMVPGGVICGDDQHHPPIRQALTDCFDPREVEVMATVWSWRKP